MFFDTRPFQYPVFLICSHELAEQVSKATKKDPYSISKSPTINQGFRRLIGDMSILSEEGENWKTHRRLFNPGFAPQHILSLLPIIIDKTEIFMKRLDALAKSGHAVELESYCTDVTFDIICEVVTNLDVQAQSETGQVHEMLKNFKLLGATYIGENGLVPNWMNLPLHIKRYLYSIRLDAVVKKCIKDKYDEIKSGASTLTKSDRSVVALALKDTQELTPTVLQSIADQIKTFLLAGHDTTSILLQRLFYALSIHPHCLAKIRAEHDAVFGNSDPREVFLTRPDETMNGLVYTSACIKEALRLWPPAATARMAYNGFNVRTSDGEEVCADKCVIYSCQHILHRDKKVYGDTADDFVPERWIGDVDTSSEAKDVDGGVTGESNIPISAWRPFERGPRNCIGQELANVEVRVILACTMRRYDFVKVGLGEVDTDAKGQPMIDGKGRYKLKSELLSVS